MTTGWAPAQVTSILNAARGASTFQLTSHYIQLHDGDPGVSGTANVINSGDRALVTFAAASGVQMASNSAAVWESWVGADIPTHFSSWSASAGGTFQLSGIVVVSEGVPEEGGTATIPSGGLVFTHDVAGG